MKHFIKYQTYLCWYLVGKVQTTHLPHIKEKSEKLTPQLTLQVTLFSNQNIKTEM